MAEGVVPAKAYHLCSHTRERALDVFQSRSEVNVGRRLQIEDQVLLLPKRCADHLRCQEEIERTGTSRGLCSNDNKAMEPTKAMQDGRRAQFCPTIQRDPGAGRPTDRPLDQLFCSSPDGTPQSEPLSGIVAGTFADILLQTTIRLKSHEVHIQRRSLALNCWRPQLPSNPFCYKPRLSSSCRWLHIGAKVLAAIMPLAAAAGTPMPGWQESPQA
jgi:hypothetical protein